MSTSTTQALLIALMGLVVVAVIVRLSRRGQLSFRYAFGWIVVSSLGISAGFLIPLALPIASALGLSAAGFLSAVALLVFVAIAVQLSVSISGLQQQVRTLTEELARLRQITAPRND